VPCRGCAHATVTSPAASIPAATDGSEPSSPRRHPVSGSGGPNAPPGVRRATTIRLGASSSRKSPRCCTQDTTAAPDGATAAVTDEPPIGAGPSRTGAPNAPPGSRTATRTSTTLRAGETAPAMTAAPPGSTATAAQSTSAPRRTRPADGEPTVRRSVAELVRLSGPSSANVPGVAVPRRQVPAPGSGSNGSSSSAACAGAANSRNRRTVRRLKRREP
jgi:hypothetical protein